MKKLNIVFVVASLFAGISFADTNTVASANVLGYTKVIDPASNRYVLISAPFNCGTGTVSTLQDILGTNQLRQSFLAARCDQILLWNVSAQQYVQYVQKTNGNFYYYTNFTGSAINPTVTRGQALWIKSPVAAYAPSNKIVVISGNVPSDGSYTNTVTGNPAKPLNFIANPYPVEMDINALINTNDGAKGNAIVSRADKIMMWDDASQQYIHLSLKLSGTVPAVNNKWLYYTNFTATTPPAINVKPGQGFWYQTTNAFTWVETKTYTLE
jgi:hypothetical protein